MERRGNGYNAEGSAKLKEILIIPKLHTASSPCSNLVENKCEKEKWGSEGKVVMAFPIQGGKWKSSNHQKNNSPTFYLQSWEFCGVSEDKGREN